MKRFLLPVLAAAALLTACGSSGHKAGVTGRPIARVVPPSPTSLRFSAASNREFARRDAEKLIRIVVVPHAARRVAAVPKSAPSWFRVELSASPRGTAVEHRIWVVDKPLKDVVRFLRTHARSRPRPELPLNRSTNRIGSRPYDDYTFRPVPGRSSSRWLNIAMLALPSGATVITAQAGDEWIKPPPRSAELPRTVRRIDITSRYYHRRPSVLLHVRDRYDVGSIVAWVNGLGVAPYFVCFDEAFGGIFPYGPVVTLTFGNAQGKVLARATLDRGCNPFSLTVDGQKAQPLFVGDLLVRIQQRLDADLSPPLPSEVATCLRGRGWQVRTVAHGLTARKGTHPTTITFHATGKVTTIGRSHPAIARCLRSSPRYVYYG
jgi:hypothetical protein